MATGGGSVKSYKHNNVGWERESKGKFF